MLALTKQGRFNIALAAESGFMQASGLDMSNFDKCCDLR